jgi:MbtH protein
MSTQEIYGIIVNTERQFGVWPAHRKLPRGWHFTGPTGTRAEMEQLLREQFVETLPTPLITPGRRPKVQFAD